MSHAIDAEASAARIASLVPTASALSFEELQKDARYQAAKHMAQSFAAA
jgi:hypothetical protein